MTNENISATRNQIGVAMPGDTPTPHGLATRDLATTSRELQRRATSLLLDRGEPATGIGRLVEAFFPDPIRAVARRTDRQLVDQEATAQVRIHQVIQEARVEQAEIVAKGFVRACQLEANEALGRRAIGAAHAIDADIARAGADFDKRIDADAVASEDFKSQAAVNSAGARIAMRSESRLNVERAILASVEETVAGVGRL